MSALRPRVRPVVWHLATALLLATSPAHGQTAGVTLDLLPNTVQFPPDGTPVEVFAVLRNGSANELAKVRLRPGHATGVTVQVEGEATHDLLPNGDAAWVLKVSRNPAALLAGSVSILAEFDRLPDKEKEKEKPVPRVVYASITLTRPEVETVEQLVTIEPATDIERLHSGDAGSIDLTLTNKSATPLTASIRAVFPDPTSLRTKTDGTIEVDLPARGSQVVRIPIEAFRRVRAGKETVDLVVTARWGAGPHQLRTAVATKQITVDVLAESNIVQMLGVAPLLLFLPGFLAVKTWDLLWRVGLFKTRYDTQQFPLQGTSLDFYLVSVLLSFLLLGVHHFLGLHYLTAYGFMDLVLLYVLSVLGWGAVSYGAVMGVRWLAIRRRVPTVADTPLQALRRLAAQRLGVELPTADRGTAPPQQVFLLEPPALAADRSTTWVAPPIKLYWMKPAPERDSLDTRLDTEINRGPTARSREVVKLVEKAVAADVARVEWGPSGGIRSPAEMETKDVAAIGAPVLILDIQ